MDPEPIPEREEKSMVPAAFLAGLVIVALVIGGVLLLSRATQPKQVSAVQKLPFGPDEQAYAPQIHFQNIHLAESENLLRQKFTYVAANISNDGPRPIRALEITIEFHDPFKQVILKDTDRIIDRTDPPLGAAKQQDFQVTIEQSVPAEWDQQYPSIRVTGLLLQ